MIVVHRVLRVIVWILAVYGYCCAPLLGGSPNLDETKGRGALEEHMEAARQRYSEEVLSVVTQAYERMAALDGVSMKEVDLFDIALFIETTGKDLVKQGKRFLSKEDTGLAKNILCDPRKKRFFIQLDHQPLGQGCHKEVTKGVQYDTAHPELVAYCTFLDDPRREVTILRKLQGARGICEFRSVAEWKDRHGKKRYAMILKLYNAHSLRHFLSSTGKLSLHEKLTIARDLLEGLVKIHQNSYVHRDLHSKNFLVHRDKDAKASGNGSGLQAAIIDFGQTCRHDFARKLAPRVQTPMRYNPPESFRRGTELVNCYSIDVYALGCNFYALIHGKNPPWSVKEQFAKTHHMSRDHRNEFGVHLAEKIRKHVQPRKEVLRQKVEARSLTTADRFELLILRMLHTDPSKRGSAGELAKKMNSLLSRHERALKSSAVDRGGK